MGISANNSNGKEELKKGPWTREEDQKLLDYIQQHGHGHGSWSSLPSKAGLQRCGKSCRLRWTNYLRPDIKRGKFVPHEEKTIIRLHALLGNKWSAIAAHLPKRTDNEIKNYWNTRLKKRLARMGIDPTTHMPKHNQYSTHASHMAQWETARLEAEARLVRESKLRSNLRLLQKVNVRPLPPYLDVLKVWQTRSGSDCSFFGGSPGSLESPTSTVNFSCNSYTVSAVNSLMANDVVSMKNYSTCDTENSRSTEAEKGKMENSVQPFCQDNSSSRCGYDVAGSMDLTAADFGYTVGTELGIIEEFEDKGNYWNDLLNMVTSSVELPRF